MTKNESNMKFDEVKTEKTYGTVFDEIEEETDKCNPFIRQSLACSGPILITVAGAMVSGYSAILLPQLKEPGSGMQIDQEAESWIASMAPLPMAVGCIFGGWSMERMGRINANLVASLVAVVGWFLIYYGTDISWLLAGRLLTGFSVGASCPGVTCYMGEVTQPKYRGLFLSSTALAISVGLLLTHLMGTFLTWRTVALISTFVPVGVMVAFLLVPESHVWYVRRGDFIKARKAFYWFRGHSHESRDELNKIINDRVKSETSGLTSVEMLRECCKMRFVRPFLIINLFFATMQLTGNNAVIFYTVSIMQSTVSTLDRYSAMLTVDVIRIVMSVVGCILAKKYKVRPLTIISGLGCSASLYFLALFINLSDSNGDNPVITFMPMVGFVAYTVIINVGLLTLPWAVCGELFPPVTKGVGGGISISLNFLVFFVVVKTGPDLFTGLGNAGTFTVYGTLVLVGTALLYYFLPETKGKTLRDIEKFFVEDDDDEQKKNVGA